MKFKNVLRLYHTVKYLRWQQIFYRVYYGIIPAQVPKLSESIHRPVGTWEWQRLTPFEQSLFDNGSAVFLGKEGHLSSAADWNSPDQEKLWLYNLHYFDDLNKNCSVGLEEFHRGLIERWIEENPPGVGNGWEPYPISLRVVNWVKWCSRNSCADSIYSSLMLQAEFLANRLEYHILGNHLFANAKALIFVGSFLEGDKADALLNKGLKILDKQLSEQFLPDGGHFELSPMYHKILLLDLLELIELASSLPSGPLKQREGVWSDIARGAIAWLKGMLHPDGEIPFFNDASFGVSVSSDFIFQYASHLGIAGETPYLGGISLFRESGYSRLAWPHNVVIFDHAAVGPDYLPGHAHADTLSLEWSVGKQRVLVNSGTSLYGVSAERIRQRKTAAHNTVVINGSDSSEVWGGFRVARRARVIDLNVSKCADYVEISAGHDGYHRLEDSVTHIRTLVSSDKELKITDHLRGDFQTAEAGYHIHPDAELLRVDDQTLEISLGDGSVIAVQSDHQIDIKNSSWHPEFGASVKNKKLLIRFAKPTLEVRFQLIRVA